MYRVARLPQFRTTTGVTMNPMDGIPRDRVQRRPLALTLDQLRLWIAHASPHVQLALAIGALAPKLRLTNILALRWDAHFDPELKYITVAEHKTDRVFGHEMVVPIIPQLRGILEAARAGATGPYVVSYGGRPVTSIKTALRNAARRAKIPYGWRVRGATFHTLRHLAATMLAELRVPEALRKETMGHKDAAAVTTRRSSNTPSSTEPTKA
jgi:integrase